MKEKILLVLAICAMTALLAGTAGSTTWNAASDFVGGTPGVYTDLTASGMGVDGVWSYGYDSSPDPGTTFQAYRKWGYTWANIWTYNDMRADGLDTYRAGVGYAGAANSSGFTNPANSIFGFNEIPNANLRPLIMRWTAPTAMYVDLSGFGAKARSAAGWCATIDFGVQKNGGANLWTGTSTSETDIKTFSISAVSVAAGDTIDLWMKTQAEYDFFSENMIVTQVEAPVPEPASIVALVGGLVSLMGLRRRKA